MRTKKISAVMCMVFVLVVLFCVPVYASGDVAGAIEGTWQTASQQIKTVVDHVVFPAIAYMTDPVYEVPYEGAKEMLLVEEVDQKEFLTGLFHAMYDELPLPKPKKKK